MKEPPKAAVLFPTLTPPKGESVQKRTIGAIAQPDTLAGEWSLLIAPKQQYRAG